MKPWLYNSLFFFLFQGIVGCSQQDFISGHPYPPLTEKEKMRLCSTVVHDRDVCYQLKDEVCFGLNTHESFLECVKKNTGARGNIRIDPMGGLDMQRRLHTKSHGD